MFNYDVLALMLLLFSRFGALSVFRLSKSSQKQNKKQSCLNELGKMEAPQDASFL
jgi:hypothetical protein